MMVNSDQLLSLHQALLNKHEQLAKDFEKAIHELAQFKDANQKYDAWGATVTKESAELKDANQKIREAHR